MKYLLFTALLSISSSIFSQVNFDKNLFEFYTGKGKASTYKDLYNECLEADVILFGELHNNSVMHWLQLELAQDLQKDSSKKLILGAEMFEMHQQIPLSEYVSGVSDYKTLSSETKLWPNCKTDYLPLVNVAKENELEFVATNIPRILAKRVARVGMDSLAKELTDSAKKLCAPLPFKMDYKAPGYKELMEMNFGSAHGLNTQFMVQAQAIKDATMAYNIAQAYQTNTRILHFNGDFHSKNYGGIYWHLKQYNKKLKVLIISSTESEELKFDPEWKKLGDFILVTPANAPKSY